MSRFAFLLISGLAALLTSVNGIAQSASGASAPASAPVAAPFIAGVTGPTPFPKDAKDWPGKGAIRVFGWMTENRKTFWENRERRQGAVVFAGDSLIGGWGSMAKDFGDLSVANRGIGGEVTRGLLFRFKEDVLDLHPKAIVLLTGTNDLSAEQDPQQTRSNIIEMLDMAEKNAPGVPIVLCTLPPRKHAQSPVDPAKVIALNKIISAIPQGRSNVVVLDLYTLLADPDGLPHESYFAKDRLHIAAPGYQRFHDALLPVLKQLHAV